MQSSNLSIVEVQLNWYFIPFASKLDSTQFCKVVNLGESRSFFCLWRINLYLCQHIREAIESELLITCYDSCLCTILTIVVDISINTNLVCCTVCYRKLTISNGNLIFCIILTFSIHLVDRIHHTKTCKENRSLTILINFYIQASENICSRS